MLLLNPETIIECRNIHCDWTGKTSLCKIENYCSPKSSWRHKGGREGVHYICPKCNEIAKVHYWRLS